VRACADRRVDAFCVPACELVGDKPVAKVANARGGMSSPRTPLKFLPQFSEDLFHGANGKRSAACSSVMHSSGSCTAETHVAAGRVKRASPLGMIWSRSECIQESQDPISRSESHSVCAKGRQLLQGAFLCGQVCFDIHVGCLNTFMTEPQGDNTDVHAGL
jgi:hypothetical protein